MLRVLPLSHRVKKQIQKYDLHEKFEKALCLFQINFKHPSLHTEVLQPKHRKIYSFRIDKKYRAIFLYKEKDRVEIILVSNHYE